MFHNKASFYGEELLETRPTPKLEGHPLSAVRDCLFNIFTTTLLIGGRSSTHNLRMCHAVVMDPLITGRSDTEIQKLKVVHVNQLGIACIA
jgi:hypothetical protein